MIFIVSENYVLDQTLLDRNLLSQNLKPALILAQKVNLTEVLGDKLVDKIYLEIQNGTLSGDYKKLVDDYLVDVVTYWSLYYSVTNLLSKFGNRGLQQESSENSSSSDLSVYRTLKSEYKDLSEYFSQRANKWVFKNRNLFAEYEICGSDDGTQPASSKNKLFGGLVI